MKNKKVKIPGANAAAMGADIERLIGWGFEDMRTGAIDPQYATVLAYQWGQDLYLQAQNFAEQIDQGIETPKGFN